MPLIIRLSDSVAPLVKMISFGVALISEAICWREVSTASSPAQPKEWLRLADRTPLGGIAIPVAGHARSNQHGTVNRGDYIQRADLRRLLRQLIPSAGPVLCGHQRAMRQLLQHLGHQRRRDAILLSNFVG